MPPVLPPGYAPGPGGCTMTIQESSHSIEGALIAFVGDTPAVNMAGRFKEGWRSVKKMPSLFGCKFNDSN